MPYAYSEDTLIEQTAISIFKDLKWETANVLQGERFGAAGTLGRASEADVLLRERFLRAVQLFNPGLPEAAFQAAFEILKCRRRFQDPGRSQPRKIPDPERRHPGILRK